MSEPGSLIPLIAIDAMNQFFLNNYAMNHDTLNAISNIQYQILKNSDIIIFDGLIIPKTVNLNNIKHIQVIIGGNIIYNIPFELIIHHNNIKYTNNNYLITISNELLIFDSSNNLLKNNVSIPLVSLLYHNVHFQLSSNTDNFNYQIITKKLYFEDNIRHSLVLNQQEVDIYQYQEFPINTQSNIIYPDKISTGIYIKLNSKLTDYELCLNYHRQNYLSQDLIEYYSFLQYKKESWTKQHLKTLFYTLNKYLPNEIILHIESFIEKKNEYMYYIPFGIDNNIDCTINFNRIDIVHINIKTEEDKYDGCFYVKNVNKLRIINGMAGLVFSN